MILTPPKSELRTWEGNGFHDCHKMGGQEISTIFISIVQALLASRKIDISTELNYVRNYRKEINASSFIVEHGQELEHGNDNGQSDQFWNDRSPGLAQHTWKLTIFIVKFSSQWEQRLMHMPRFYFQQVGIGQHYTVLMLLRKAGRLSRSTDPKKKKKKRTAAGLKFCHSVEPRGLSFVFDEWHSAIAPTVQCFKIGPALLAALRAHTVRDPRRPLLPPVHFFSLRSSFFLFK